MAACALGWIAVTAGAQTWTFDSDQQGWIARDIVGYSEVGAASELSWNSAGPGLGGYVSKFDPSMNTFCFAAPIVANSDYSAFVGGTLTFSMTSDFSDWTADNGVILRGLDAGNLTTIVSAIPVPGLSWSDYVVNLNASSFRVGSQGGAMVSDTAFNSIMGSLSTFMISGEYGNGVKETTRLDSVSFNAIPEPSTYAALLGSAALALVAVRRYRRRG